MKAIVKYAAEPGHMEIREVPEPTPGPGQVKIKVVAAGICGSDAKGYMEAEGIKMKHGNLYLGFASHGPGAKRWANVFRY